MRGCKVGESNTVLRKSKDERSRTTGTQLDSSLSKIRACEGGARRDGCGRGGGAWGCAHEFYLAVSHMRRRYSLRTLGLSSARPVSAAVGRRFESVRPLDDFYRLGRRQTGDPRRRWCKTVAPRYLVANRSVSGRLFASERKLAGDRGRSLVLEN